jgi:hypothetical protein
MSLFQLLRIAMNLLTLRLRMSLLNILNMLRLGLRLRRVDLDI